MFWVLHGHGIIALLALFLGYKARRALLAGSADFRRWSVYLAIAVSGLTASGIALYARYREPGGVRAYLLQHHQVMHSVWFEWKENLGFFALILALALLAKPPKAVALPLLITLLIALVGPFVIGVLLTFYYKAVA